MDTTTLDTPDAPDTAERADLAERQPVKFTRETLAELRKVVWPDKKQTVRYTGVVLAFLAGMVAFIGGVDAGGGSLVKLIFG